MALCAFVLPLQKLAKGGAAVAILGLLFGREFGESLPDFRKVEQRIVAEAIGAARRAQNETFGAAVKGSQSVSVAGRCDDADKAAGAVFVRNVMQLAQQAGVVGLDQRSLRSCGASASPAAKAWPRSSAA